MRPPEDEIECHFRPIRVFFPTPPPTPPLQGEGGRLLPPPLRFGEGVGGRGSTTVFREGYLTVASATDPIHSLTEPSLSPSFLRLLFLICGRSSCSASGSAPCSLSPFVLPLPEQR